MLLTRDGLFTEDTLRGDRVVAVLESGKIQYLNLRDLAENGGVIAFDEKIVDWYILCS